MEITDVRRNIVFLHKHFVALENVVFPEGLLELWECIKYFNHQIFLYLHDLCHRVSCGF